MTSDSRAPARGARATGVRAPVYLSIAIGIGGIAAAPTAAVATDDEVELVSLSPKMAHALPYAWLGTQGAHHSVSRDGRYVAFQAYANGHWHIYVRDTVMGRTQRVSVSSSGEPANYDSEDPSISDDGRYVVFESAATNLAAGDRGWGGIFLHDRWSGATERVDVNTQERSANHYSYAPAVSGNGRFVVFVSYASNLVADDANGHLTDVFVRDRTRAVTELASVATNGLQSDGTSEQPSISADGRYVVFVSNASNLVTDGVAGGFRVYLRDRVASVTELESRRDSGFEANESWPCVSADGRYVAFGSSAADFVTHDTNRATDIFVRDRDRDIIRRVSVSGIEAQANGGSDFPSISADGRYVAFQSSASNLVPRDVNDMSDVFVRDLERGLTKRISSSGHTPYGNLDSISADGRHVAFDSAASVAGATGVYLQQVGDTGWDIYGLALRPGALDFGSVALQTSATQAVWVKNKSTLPLPIRRIELAGPDASQFSFDSKCGSSIPVDTGCPVKVTFHPASKGPKYAALKVFAGEDLLRTAALAGVGAVP